MASGPNVTVQGELNESNFISGETGRAWWKFNWDVCASQGRTILQRLDNVLGINVSTTGPTPKMFARMIEIFQTLPFDTSRVIASLRVVATASPATATQAQFNAVSDEDAARYSLACVYLAFYYGQKDVTFDGFQLGLDSIFMPYSEGQLPDALVDPNAPGVVCRAPDGTVTAPTNTSQGSVSRGDFIDNGIVGLFAGLAALTLAGVAAAIWKSKEKKGKRRT
jgi:hypothetical protein